MKRFGAALAVAAIAFPATPAAAGSGARDTAFPEPPSPHTPQRDSEAAGTMAIVLGGVLLFVVIAGPLVGAESRPAWRRVDRKPSFRMVGSMRREDWPPSEFRP
jgi:hypothetical protein